MHNFKISFSFVKHFINPTYSFAVFNDKTTKIILVFKHIYFNVQRHRALYQRFDKKNYIYTYNPI